MKQIKNLLKTRESYLLQLKKEKERALKTVPDGHLRISTRGNRALYYHRVDPQNCNGSYISNKDISLAQQLAQKDYDAKVLRSISL